MTAPRSGESGLETRRLHALAREEAVDRLAVDAENTTYPDSVKTAVVDQPPDRLGVNAELARHLANAHKTRISAYRRHNPDQVSQDVLRHTWADRLKRGLGRTYSRNCAIASFSSRREKAPSNLALIRPSRPTRNVHGSDGSRHSRTHRFSPLPGSLSS